MTTPMLITLVVYVSLLALLSIVASHRFVLAMLARRHRVEKPKDPAEWPTVVV